MSFPSARATARRASRPAAPHPWLFILGAAACVAGVVGTYWAFVLTTTGQFADESALREAEASTPVARGPFLDFLDMLPALSVLIAVVVIGFVTLARRRWSAALTALACAVGANLTSQVIKTVMMDRPDLGVPTLTFNSLPSGHTTLAASAAAAVVLVLSPRWRPLAAAIGGTYAALAGVSTLINLWHRPADVVAAFLVVAAWTLLGGLVIMRRGNRWNVWDGYGEHWAASPLWPRLCWLVGLLAGALAVGAYLYAQWAGPAPIPGTGRLPLFYVAGIAAIVSAGYLLSALAVWLFSHEARRRS